MTGRDPLRKIFISSRDTRTINLFNSLELWSPCYRYLSRKKKKKRKKTRELGLEKEKKKKIEIYSSDKRDAQRDIYEIGSTSHPPRRNPSTQVVSHTSDDSDEWLDETTMLYVQCFSIYIIIIVTITVGGPTSKQASKPTFTRSHIGHTRLITNSPLPPRRFNRRDTIQRKKKGQTKSSSDRATSSSNAHALFLFFLLFSPFCF